MIYHPKVPVWVVTCRGALAVPGLRLLGLLCGSLMASGTEGLPAALCPTPGGTAAWAHSGEDDRTHPLPCVTITPRGQREGLDYFQFSDSLVE